MAPNVTLLDLVTAVSEEARGETEVIATVVYLVNSGAVRLCGTFKGARFDIDSIGPVGGASCTTGDACRHISHNPIIELARLLEANRLARARAQRR